MSRRLARDVSLVGAVGIGLGAIIGAGIYVVTGVAAGMAGPAFVVGLALAGVVATANALSSAELAARYPRSGGSYEYGYELLGPGWGFTAGWMFVSGKLTAAGTVAIGLSGYAAALLPGLDPRAVAVGAVLVFTALNYVGIRRSAAVNLAIVAVTVLALVGFAGLGAASFEAANLSPFWPEDRGAVLRAAAVLFFAFTGYARIATLGEEVRDPSRTIPRAIGITIGTAVVLYGAVALVAVGAVGAAALAETAAPLARAAEAFGGPVAVTIVSIGGITAMLGVILSQLLGLSRMVFAMARRGDLPGGLARVHPRHAVPDRAVLVVGAVAAALAATGALEEVVIASAFTILVYYGIANLSALRLPEADRRYPRLVPWTGLLGCATLALSLSLRAVLLGVLWIGAGHLLRAILRRPA